MLRLLLLPGALLLAGAAAPPQEDAGAWRPLFNGRDFEGWTIQLARPMQGQFLHDRNPEPVFRVVEVDGAAAIHVTGRVWGGLVTAESFGDFHLRAEYRWKDAPVWPPLAWRDTGILYHSIGEPRSTHVGVGPQVGTVSQPGERSHPGRGCYTECLEYQVVADVDAERFGRRGHLVGQFAYFGRALADLALFEPKEQRADDWNLVEVVAFGDRVRHYLNGELVAEARDARYVLGEETQRLTKGPLQLQSESGEVYWRGIEVRSVKSLDVPVGRPAEPKPAATSAATPLPDPPPVSDGSVALFNGRDLTGWTTYLGWPMEGQVPVDRNPEPVFEVVALDGEPALRVSGRVWGTLSTVEEYGDYELSLEFRWGREEVWPPLTWRESGVMLHAFGPPNACVLGSPSGGPLSDPPGSGLFPESIEVELAHRGPSDQAPRDLEVGRIYSRGHVRFDVTENVRPQKPPNEWNRLVIRCVADELRSELNGVEVSRVTRIRVDSEDGTRPLTRGRISLQSESCELFFRRIQLRPLERFDD